MLQSSGPLRYATVEGMDARDIRVHNYPPGWNAAPSQDLLVIRRNHKLVPRHSTRCAGVSFPIGARTQSTRRLVPDSPLPAMSICPCRLGGKSLPNCDVRVASAFPPIATVLADLTALRIWAFTQPGP